MFVMCWQRLVRDDLIRGSHTTRPPLTIWPITRYWTLQPKIQQKNNLNLFQIFLTKCKNLYPFLNWIYLISPNIIIVALFFISRNIVGGILWMYYDQIGTEYYMNHGTIRKEKDLCVHLVSVQHQRETAYQVCTNLI